ncbi:hypothetical protein CEUSTIGMA_g6729.t1 [Chlamydomonas eustigma]|uniref:Guanylate cyclase domain-containing protein n=1 Tax=Chlamydomonas eustigma TaxID=1157962 RepID=A0A250X879_9CHLO|nr:hypothetical protein CEUSTIGMA_g6729.t1 [Chlamydomonas eustigma]|eukprot:GAX79288.1 hypothetical protein CEUSTIGMA_g6729.t1 [Chlamydomonas eustigma]
MYCVYLALLPFVWIGRGQTQSGTSLSTNVICDSSSQRETLIDLFNDTSGQTWLTSYNWPVSLLSAGVLNQTSRANFLNSTPITSGSCDSNKQQGVAAIMAAAQNLTIAPIVLPDHCCWFGVSCCTPNTCFGVSASACNCSYGLVTDIYLSHNNLTGRLRSAVAGGEALGCSLNSLDLHRNSISGTIPPEITVLSMLSTLNLAFNKFSGDVPASFGNMSSLQYLSLTSNFLTGSIPSQLCEMGPGSSLLNLYLANNQLTGVLNISTCGKLNYLDVSDNSLSGYPVELAPYNHLQSLNAAGNNFSSLLYGSQLISIDFSGNSQINGPFPSAVEYMPFLSSANLQGINITVSAEEAPEDAKQRGTIPLYLPSYLDSINSMDFSNNFISGTLPTTIGDLIEVSSMNFYNNTLTGTVPPALVKLLAEGTSVDLRLNFMSCCGSGFQKSEGLRNVSYMSYNLSVPRLPPGLFFSTYLRPVVSNQRLSQSSVMLNLGNATYTGLSCPYFVLSNQSDAPSNLLDFYLDPEYFLYEGCQCQAGYHTITYLFNGFNVVQCMVDAADNTSWLSTMPWLPAIFALLGATLAFGLAWFFLLHKRSLKVLKQLSDQKKGRRPPPTSGSMSIVVTDIEGFSELMKVAPELMMRALITHNNLIQKAKMLNFGHVIDQEGDSYSIAFEDHLDAVKFCLQAQIMFTKQRWPKGLFREAEDVPGPRVSSVSNKNVSILVKGGSGKLKGGSLKQGSLKQGSVKPNGSRGLLDNLTTGSGKLTSSSGDSSSLMMKESDLASCRESGGPRHSAGRGTGGHKHGMLPLDSNGSNQSAGSQRGAGSNQGSRDLNRESGVPGPEKSGNSRTAPRSGSGGGWTRQKSSGNLDDLAGATPVSPLPHAKAAAASKGIVGLKVRMGIATGVVPVGTRPAASSLMERAKVISDAAAGGQILMCQYTFAAAKEKTQELGCMTENGLDLDMLDNKSWWSLFSTKNTNKVKEALLLDMGEYMYCPKGYTPPQVFTAKDLRLGTHKLQQEEETGDTRTAQPPTAGATTLAVSTDAGISMNHTVLGTGSGTSSLLMPTAPKLLKLYQVLAPSFTGRGPLFGSHLSLKEDWICINKPYYSAPGMAPPGCPPTEITCVFCMVEDGKLYASRYRQDAMEVGQNLVAIMRSVLGQVAGGYVVKYQYSDLKFMLVFTKPEDAVYWCMAVQFCITYGDWPTSALNFWRMESGDQGQIMFRGPRQARVMLLNTYLLKMGVCKGTPSTIIPDHVGRADYLGPCINMAARFMDAAAHGGQVACTMQLALNVIASWSSWAQYALSDASDDGAAAAAAATAEEGVDPLKVDKQDAEHLPSEIEGDTLDSMGKHVAFKAVSDPPIMQLNKLITDPSYTIGHAPPHVSNELMPHEGRHEAVVTASMEAHGQSLTQGPTLGGRGTSSAKVHPSAAGAPELGYEALSWVRDGPRPPGVLAPAALENAMGGAPVAEAEAEAVAEASEEGAQQEQPQTIPPLPSFPTTAQLPPLSSAVGGRRRASMLPTLTSPFADMSNKVAPLPYSDPEVQAQGTAQGLGMKASEPLLQSLSTITTDTSPQSRSTNNHTAEAVIRPENAVPALHAHNRGSRLRDGGGKTLEAGHVAQQWEGHSQLQVKLPLSKEQEMNTLATELRMRLEEQRTASSGVMRNLEEGILAVGQGGEVVEDSSGVMAAEEEGGECKDKEEEEEEEEEEDEEEEGEGEGEEEDEEEDGWKDVTWFPIVDNVVPGRWLDITAFWTGRFLFKGSPDTLTMINMIPAWYAKRRYPKEAPQGKGIQLSTLEGVAATSMVPLLQVIQSYREHCPVPLSTLKKDASSAHTSRAISQAASRAVSRNASGRILSSRTSPEGTRSDGSSSGSAPKARAVIRPLFSFKKTFNMMTNQLSRISLTRISLTRTSKDLEVPQRSAESRAQASRRHFLQAQQHSLEKRVVDGVVVDPMLERSTWDNAMVAGDYVPDDGQEGQGTGSRKKKGSKSGGKKVFKPRSV